MRRLDAEVLIDALCQVTGSTEKYTSAIPEPFTFIPEAQRSIALPDGSISSSFLEMFGRPSRDTGMESERNNRPTAGQSLHLLNSSHIQRKIEQSRTVQNLAQSKTNPRELIGGLYLATLSRFPSEDELKIVTAHFAVPPGEPAGSRRGSRLGPGQQPGVSLSALIRKRTANSKYETQTKFSRPVTEARFSACDFQLG